MFFNKEKLKIVAINKDKLSYIIMNKLNDNCNLILIFTWIVYKQLTVWKKC